MTTDGHRDDGATALQSLLDGLPGAHFAVRGTRILWANEAALKLCGSDSPDVAGRHLEAFVDLDASVLHTLSASPDMRSVDCRWQPPGVPGGNADAQPVQLAFGRPLDDDLRPVAVIPIRLVDVTGRAERAQRMESLGKLTGGIAHDFNNLLSVILGNLEMLAPHLKDRPAAAGMLAQAQTAADRGVELTGRLLAFARRQTLQTQRVVLEPLLTETRGLLARVLGEDIDVRIVDETDVPVATDPGQLQTALINLAINARDAMPDGGRLTLAARLVDSDEVVRRCGEALPLPHVCIEVEDSGEGMTAGVLVQAFEPFFTTKTEGRGSGLGLAMVHGFVQQSRGQVEIDSAPGGGTRVRLYLPVYESGAETVSRTAPPVEPTAPRQTEEQLQEEPSIEADPVAAEAPPQASERMLRVLVVEDEASVREVAVAMLRGIGFEVFEAADGLSARRVLERERLDLLLSDVVLPGDQRGPDIALEALQRQPDLAVLFMSGYAESSVFQQFRREHEFSLISKPFRLGELRSRIDEVLARARK